MRAEGSEEFAEPPRGPAVRDDVELPEVYAVLAGTARAAARAHLDEEARARLFAIVFDGLAPRPRPARDTPNSLGDQAD